MEAKDSRLKDAADLAIAVVSLLNPVVGFSAKALFTLYWWCDEERKRKGSMPKAAVRVLKLALPGASWKCRFFLMKEICALKRWRKTGRPAYERYERAALILGLGFDIEKDEFERVLNHYKELNPKVTPEYLKAIRKASKHYARKDAPPHIKSYFAEVIGWLKDGAGIETVREHFGNRIMGWPGDVETLHREGVVFPLSSYLGNPFKDRKELKELSDWCDDSGEEPVAVVFGKPGAGKTRLAIELTKYIQRPVLIAMKMFNKISMKRFLDEFPVAPVLLLDYAASHPVLPELMDLLSSIPNLKVLLLERDHNMIVLNNKLQELLSHSKRKLINLGQLHSEVLLEIAREVAKDDGLTFPESIRMSIDRPLLAICYGYLSRSKDAESISDVASLLRILSMNFAEDLKKLVKPGAASETRVDICSLMIEAILRDGIPLAEAREKLGSQMAQRFTTVGFLKTEGEKAGLLPIEPDLVAESFVLFNRFWVDDAPIETDWLRGEVKKVLQGYLERSLLAPLAFMIRLADLMVLLKKVELSRYILAGAWDALCEWSDIVKLQPQDALLIGLLCDRTNQHSADFMLKDVTMGAFNEFCDRMENDGELSQKNWHNERTYSIVTLAMKALGKGPGRDPMGIGNDPGGVPWTPKEYNAYESVSHGRPLEILERVLQVNDSHKIHLKPIRRSVASSVNTTVAKCDSGETND